MLEEILPFERPPARRAEGSGLLTDFELWCEDAGIHPESLGAWDAYQRSANPAV